MSWVRYFSKMVFRRWEGAMSAEAANKYMNVMRMAYFFSVSTLAIYVWYNYEELSITDENQRLRELGRPVIVDKTEGHRVLRTTGAQAGLIYSYDPKTGKLDKIEFNRDEYNQMLEKEAFERAKKAQEEAIAKGRQLPPGAIKLVE